MRRESHPRKVCRAFESLHKGFRADRQASSQRTRLRRSPRSVRTFWANKIRWGLQERLRLCKIRPTCRPSTAICPKPTPERGLWCLQASTTSKCRNMILSTKIMMILRQRATSTLTGLLTMHQKHKLPCSRASMPISVKALAAVKICKLYTPSLPSPPWCRALEASKPSISLRMNWNWRCRSQMHKILLPTGPRTSTSNSALSRARKYRSFCPRLQRATRRCPRWSPRCRNHKILPSAITLNSPLWIVTHILVTDKSILESVSVFISNRW